MQIFDLPIELIAHILVFSLSSHPRPHCILAVHSTFHQLGLPLLHRDLKFASLEQLERFVSSCLPSSSSSSSSSHSSHDSTTSSRRRMTLARVPESLEITLPGGLASKKLWTVIKDVFLRCHVPSGTITLTHQEKTSGDNQRYHHQHDEQREEVQSVQFTLNSLASDPNLHMLCNTLSCINPKSFSWAGPDPDHNFSCAIVPAATDQLFAGLSTWSLLTNLSLSSISFSRCRGRSLLLLTPFSHPQLRQITLSQVVFLHPSSIAACSVQLPNLELLHCIDVYWESIYGPRVRRGDVEREFEKASGGLGLGGIDPELGALEGIQRVRSVVKCEARLERLLGGDREVA